MEKNFQNQSSCGSALGTSLTDWRSDMRNQAFRGKIAKIGVYNLFLLLKVGFKFDLVFKLKCIKSGKKKHNKNAILLLKV